MRLLNRYLYGYSLAGLNQLLINNYDQQLSNILHSCQELSDTHVKKVTLQQKLSDKKITLQQK